MATKKPSDDITAQNVTPTTGGAVHLPHSVFETWPHCRTYGSNRARSQYQATNAEVTCRHCCEQLRLRELAKGRDSDVRPERPAEKDIDDAIYALNEANLTTEGLEFLSGAFAATAPEAVHKALARLRKYSQEPNRSIRYFKADTD